MKVYFEKLKFLLIAVLPYDLYDHVLFQTQLSGQGQLADCRNVLAGVEKGLPILFFIGSLPTLGQLFSFPYKGANVGSLRG